MRNSHTVIQVIWPFLAGTAWEMLFLSSGNICSKDASQGQKEKSLVQSMGGIHTQIGTEIFPHILTNTDEEKEDNSGRKVRSKDKACLWMEQLASLRSHPIGETCLHKQRWLW